MSRGRASARAKRTESEALLVKRVPYGEADLIVGLFTEREGLVDAVARSARRSSKRFAALEPMHLLAVALDERPGAELATLVESAIVRPRLRLTQSLAALDAAGRALRWVRRACPLRTPEPDVWLETNTLLDALDDPAEQHASILLATMGLRLLSAIGWGLELLCCIRCGKPCDPRAAACLDLAAGGLVCRACGGARIILRGERRLRLANAASGDPSALDEGDAAAAIDLVDQALLAHAGIES